MSSPVPTGPRAPTPVRATRPLSWLLVSTILAQAGLAGPAWFQRPSLFELHGWLGMATLLLGAALAILAFVSRAAVWVRVTTLLVTIGAFGQIGLGYAGRRGGLAVASAVHVPLGVTLLGLAVAIAVATQVLPQRTGEA